MIRVGVSACLMGRKVRYDGGDKRDDFVTSLAGRVELVPVCPEVELGLGVPRPPIRIEARGTRTRLIMPSQGRDLTAAMTVHARRRVDELDDLAGFILKSASPSCGLAGVRVTRGARETRDGVGFFARALRARWPDLPLAEERRLGEPRRRESFLAQMVVYDGLRQATDLAEFHDRQELLLEVHTPGSYAALARLLRSPRRYRRELMAALARPATTARHAFAMSRLAVDRISDARRRAPPGLADQSYLDELLLGSMML